MLHALYKCEKGDRWLCERGCYPFVGAFFPKPTLISGGVSALVGDVLAKRRGGIRQLVVCAVCINALSSVFGSYLFRCIAFAMLGMARGIA